MITQPMQNLINAIEDYLVAQYGEEYLTLPEETKYLLIADTLTQHVEKMREEA